MNMVEAKQLIEVKKHLDKVAEGKVEYLPHLKEAHRIMSELVEHKQATLWKHILDED